MRIYVDIDDVVSETARSLAALCFELYGKRIAYEDIFVFDLQTAFGLSKAEIDALMEVAHSREKILSYPETPGASETLRKWIREGHDIEVVTGRPFLTAGPTREWLAARGLAALPVLHVDKFGREPPPPFPGAPRSLTVDEFCRRRYDFAVEDSPAALAHLSHIPGCRVAVFSRPWNAKAEFPSPAFTRCPGWTAIDALLHQK